MFELPQEWSFRIDSFHVFNHADFFAAANFFIVVLQLADDFGEKRLFPSFFFFFILR